MSRRRPRAFYKTIARSIRASLGRFLAIVGIVALGCGFYAGLQMCGPDMRVAADAYYDGTNLYDLRVASTMGLTKNDARRIAAVEGVESVMCSRSCDVMARIGDEQLATRVSSMNMDAAQSAKAQGQNVIVSDDDTYLNRTFLREGRWPQTAGECVICADKNVAGTKVGDEVTVLYGTQELDDVLRQKSFEVVGRASSSAYPYINSFGSTTLGSGMIEEYAFVTDDAFAKDMPYTEAYVSVKGAREHQSGSNEYKDCVDAVRANLEGQQDALANARLEDVRSEAQEELDDKREEFDKSKAKAQKELEDAKTKLDEAAAELATGKEDLADGQRRYDEGTRELENSTAELDGARGQLDEARAQLDSSKAKLDEGERAWQAGKQELLEGLGLDPGASLAQARKTVRSKRKELEQGRAKLEDGIAQAEQGVVQAQEGVSSIEAAMAQLDTQIAQAPDEQTKEALTAQRSQLEQQAEQAQQGLAQAQATKQQLEEQLAQLPSTDELDRALSGIDELERTRATLDENAAKLAEGERQLRSGEQDYAAGQEQYWQGASELEDARIELTSGREELEDGEEEYAKGKEEYEDAKAEAESELADAQAKIDDAQAKIDDLKTPDIYVLDRSQNEGIATYNADSKRMDSIAAVFPFVFFLVAALVSLTTMTRMVDDERIEIGTYKALGYSKSHIAAKYLSYAGVASVAGALLGILALTQVIPLIVTVAYSVIYTVPLWQVPLPVDLTCALASGGMGVGITLVATYAAVVASLREGPATLMLPRAPASGKRILLERVGPIWRRLSFSWKVTCRNLFRYKRRMAMTVIGISGCTALLLVGFGLHDSIWDIIDCQYGPVIHYDTTIGLDDDATNQDVRGVEDYLVAGGATGVVRVRQENMQAGSVDKDVELLRVQVVVPESDESLADAVTLRNRQTGEAIALGQDAVVVTEKIALKYGLDEGSKVVLYDQDDTGNVVGDGHALVVTGVAENYVGNLVYVGHDAWAQVDATEPTPNTVYARLDTDEKARTNIANALHEFAHVSTIVYSDVIINMYRSMLSVVDMVVVLLIVSAGALAFIVLYNLTNINITERVREIASLKVLGFTKGEVYAYIFREIALLALLGDVLGLVLGTMLESFVVTTAEVDYVMFGRTIHLSSYVYGFALTLVFTALILACMRLKLDRVNMVESLKSID